MAAPRSGAWCRLPSSFRWPKAQGSSCPLAIGYCALPARQLVVWAKDPAMAQRVIAVNVSAKQFRQAQFVDSVMAALQATGARAQPPGT